MIAKLEQSEFGRVLYGYVRVSDEKQVQSGLSIEAQEKELRAYFDSLNMRRNNDGLPPYIWGDVYIDKAVSAHKVSFLRRQAGGVLNVRLKPGDHVAVVKLDRAFRSLKDLIKVVYDSWLPRGISLHVINMNLDASSAIGKLMLHMIGAIGEFESAMRSERLKSANAIRKARNQATNQRTPVGKKRHGKRFVNDPYETAIMRYILHMRDVEQISWPKMQSRLLCARVKRSTGGDWHHRSIRDAYALAKTLNLTPTPTIERDEQ